MTKDVINNLISCKKTITIKPRKVMYQDQRNNYTMRNEFSCISSDGKNRFEVFIRYNTAIPTVFSIGLKYQTESSTVIICRYNGKHYHKNKIGDNSDFDDYHIHMLYDHQLSDETEESMDAIQTNDYICFDEALFAFLNNCRIDNWKAYFPGLENKINQLKIEGV